MYTIDSTSFVETYDRGNPFIYPGGGELGDPYVFSPGLRTKDTTDAWEPVGAGLTDRQHIMVLPTSNLWSFIGETYQAITNHTDHTISYSCGPVIILSHVTIHLK